MTKNTRWQVLHKIEKEGWVFSKRDSVTRVKNVKFLYTRAFIYFSPDKKYALEFRPALDNM